jgi:two-component system cell cycle response regulator
MVAPPSEGIDVLVVDDDDDSRELLCISLSRLGYPCRTAGDGVEALAMFREKPASIVVSDWSMPRMTGLALCEELKREEPAPYVLLVTAFDGRARLLEGLRAGADDFMRKPLDFDELEVRLMAAARLIQTERALMLANRRLRRDSEQSFKAARTDPLTGIGNRRRLDEDLARIVGDGARYGHKCSAVLCDVDEFKLYNDTQGHLAGDAVLQKIGEILRRHVRTTDLVYRYGGEEFLLLLREQTASESMLAVERLRARVEGLAIPHPSSRAGVVTFSAGIAQLGTETAPEWLARADAALYDAKGQGRNRVCMRE